MDVPYGGGQKRFDESREVSMYSIIDSHLESAYLRQAEGRQGLAEFALDLAPELADLFAGGVAIAQNCPDVENHKDLLRKGFLGFIVTTAVDIEGSDDFLIPSIDTFIEGFRIVYNFLDRDAMATAHEWSMMPSFALSLGRAGEESRFLFSNPDARMASMIVSVITHGLSRGMLELDFEQS